MDTIGHDVSNRGSWSLVLHLPGTPIRPRQVVVRHRFGVTTVGNPRRPEVASLHAAVALVLSDRRRVYLLDQDERLIAVFEARSNGRIARLDQTIDHPPSPAESPSPHPEPCEGAPSCAR